MKIIVFSDSHGNYKALSRALELNAAGLSMCVFLGDGVDDIECALEAYPTLPRVIVAGNREDYYSVFTGSGDYPKECLFDAGGIKFLALHGHRPSNVKGGLGATAAYAASKGADVVLYGHTHIADDRTVDGGGRQIRMINPGSAGRGSEPSFALLNISDGFLICGFGKL